MGPMGRAARLRAQHVRPLLRPGLPGRLRTALPDRPGVPLRERPPGRSHRRPGPSPRPVRPHGRVEPSRGAPGGPVGRPVVGDVRRLRSRSPGLDRPDAGQADRVRRPPDRSPVPRTPRGRRARRLGVGLHGVDPVDELGRRAAPRRDRRSTGLGGPGHPVPRAPHRTGSGPGREVGRRSLPSLPARPPPPGAGLPRRTGIEQLGGRRAPVQDREAAPGQRPPPGGSASFGLVRDPPVGSRRRRAGDLTPLRSRGDHRSQRPDRLGDHEPRGRHPGPLPGATGRGRDGGPARRDVGAAHRPPRGDRCPRARARGARGEGDAARPDPRLLPGWGEGRQRGRGDPRDIRAPVGRSIG